MKLTPKPLVITALIAIALYQAWLALAPTKEIALIIGEPWEDMRARSSASIDPAIPNEIAYGVPDSKARLRFLDAQYGFVTPEAKFFTISYEHDYVTSITMYPQTEPLLIDDTMKVLIHLQDQWRAGGWTVIFRDDPEFIDTPESRIALRDAPNGRTTYWQAGGKFQALLNVGRFADERYPDQERYQIILNVGRRWIAPPAKIRSGQP